MQVWMLYVRMYTSQHAPRCTVHSIAPCDLAFIPRASMHIAHFASATVVMWQFAAVRVADSLPLRQC